MTVSLKWLLDGIAAVPESDAQIVDLAIDSRDVRAGSLFLALRGAKTHGLEHAAEAAAKQMRHDIRFPVRAILEPYANNINWRWRMAPCWSSEKPKAALRSERASVGKRCCVAVS